MLNPAPGEAGWGGRVRRDFNSHRFAGSRQGQLTSNIKRYLENSMNLIQWTFRVCRLSAVLLFALPAISQDRTILSGVPSVKVEESGTKRTAVRLSQDQAKNIGCVISRIGQKYYWASRTNKELVPFSSGAFTTYVAIDGSGFVRVMDPASKAAASLMSPTEAEFDYVEHLLLGLRSITYYGKVH